MLRSLIVLCSCALAVTMFGGSVVALDDDAAPAPAPWTVDVVIDAPGAFGWQLSRDGRYGLWLSRTVNHDKDRFDTQLMLLDSKTGESRPLTVGRMQVSSPTFTADGSAILYLSRDEIPEGSKKPGEDGGAQLWRLDLAGGAPRPITAIPFGIRSFDILDDGTVVYSSRERRTDRERELKRRKDRTIVVEDPVAFAEPTGAIFTLDLETGKSTRLISPDEGPIEVAEVSPDGLYAVTSHSKSPAFQAEGKIPPVWFLRDLTRGTKQELFADRKTKPFGITWTWDSSRALITWPHSSRDGEDLAAVVFIKVLDPKTGAIVDFPLDWERGLARGLGTLTEDGFITHLADGVKPRLARYTMRADTLDLTRGVERAWIDGGDRGGWHSFTKARDANTCLVSTGDASTPAKVHLATLEGSTLTPGKKVWDEGFAAQPKARTEIVQWYGALDEPVEGIVYYPHDYEEGKKYPIIAMTHGGPHGADYDRFGENWAYAPNLFAQRGAFILMTNYHGSSDYGLAFGESIRGKYYELEVEDILSGIQMLVNQGKADPKQVGLIGWSNGAILSIAALTHRHLYAPGYDFEFLACAPGAGDVNWTSDYGNCAFGGTFDDYYLGGPPWELPELYVKKSPLFEVKRVTTPTIIFFGTEDTAVPTSQGWEWYRAMHSVGQAPVRFLLFPGEPHGLRQPSHRRRKLAEEVAWFDRYFFRREEESTEPPKGSPIELTRKSLVAARDGKGRLGVIARASLVPETIPFEDGKEIGRFEVTVAQWQAFDEAFVYGVPSAMRAHTGHPATALTPEGVSRYLLWLEEHTGDRWRLPTEEEQKKLAKSAGSGNTLDWWVGYAPSSFDAPKFVDMVRALGLPNVLHPAGDHSPGNLRFRGNDQPIYDLGGNAAEWVAGADGIPIAKGPWALVSPDAADPAPPTPDPEYTGLRLIREKAQNIRREKF